MTTTAQKIIDSRQLTDTQEISARQWCVFEKTARNTFDAYGLGNIPDESYTFGNMLIDQMRADAVEKIEPSQGDTLHKIMDIKLSDFDSGSDCIPLNVKVKNLIATQTKIWIEGAITEQKTVHSPWEEIETEQFTPKGIKASLELHLEKMLERIKTEITKTSGHYYHVPDADKYMDFFKARGEKVIDYIMDEVAHARKAPIERTDLNGILR